MNMVKSNSMKSKTAGIRFLKHMSIICEICENKVELKNLVPHLTIHTGVSDCLICIKCELKFTIQNMFYEHMRKFHALKIDCQFCGTFCYSKPMLYHHVRNMHGDIEMLKSEKPQFEAHLDDLHKAREAALKARRKRYEDQRVRPKEDCKICGKTFRTQNLKRHMETHTREKPTMCDVCGWRFSSSTGLMSHKTLVHRSRGNGRFQCHICSKMLFRKRNLDQHLQRHCGDPIHKCKECLKLYTGSFDKHVQEVHQKEGFTFDNIPTCEWCGMRFARRTSLKRHLLTHTNEKIACEICDKKLRPTTLHQHTITVHGGKRKKEMTQCRVCDKIVSKSYIFFHMAFHSDKKFQCEDCGKCFPLKHNLDTHRTSHTELRPYSCDLCEKTFKLPHHMRAHRKTHKDV